jgi:sulfotransferase famil protein
MLVFVHINKTAGTTVRYILRSSYGPRHCDVEPWDGTSSNRQFSATDLQRVRRLYPRLASIAGHRITGHIDLGQADLNYFTFVRDPMRMCASRFQYQLEHRKKRNLTFEGWITKDWARDAQTKRIAGTPDAAEAIAVVSKKDIFVGLTERFDESMVLLQVLRAPSMNIDYARRNVAGRSMIAQRLLADEAARQLIIDANRADLELYDYVSNELYPTYRRAYGPSLEDSVERFRASMRKSFNTSNLLRHRLKHNGVHRPVLHLYRQKSTHNVVDRLLT